MAQTTRQARLDGFRDAAQSLKLYRRAELTDTGGESVIEKLYVDPLPNDHVLHTTLKPSTTFLVGRKGTGKSTVFQRAQYELRRMDGVASAYVDIKTVFESSQVDSSLLTKTAAVEGAMPPEALERLLLYRAFLDALISAIREELHTRIKLKFWKRVRVSVGGTLDELFAGLDELLRDANADRFISVIGTRSEQASIQTNRSQTDSHGVGAKVVVGATPSVSVSGEAKTGYTAETQEGRNYADILMRVFNVKEYILRLKVLLAKVGITHLYIFVDDFSELPADAMQIVVDAILAPLNNWSEELVKFKVAAYPGRIYYGQIDKAKVDEINLDIYSLYGTSDIARMEEKALDFTRRLVERRLAYYNAGPSEDFFGSVKSGEDVWRDVFYATMANPRNVGYLLFFLYESNLIYGRRISLRAIRDAARRYYEEKIEAYFGMQRFLHESFEERSSIFSLKELVDAIVERARELRSHQGSSIMRDVSGRPPTSHFHVVTELDQLLATLELNFFLTKYYVMSDRDGRKVTVFALNYGLCQKYNIEFGRPTGRREYRTYYVERVFDYSAILQDYVRNNQEIVCDACGERVEFEQLEALRLFGMLCPKCKSGTCQVTNLSRKYESTLKSIDDSLLLPRIEIGILHTLGTERRALYPGDIAGELDCSYQLVGKRGKFLAERGLVNRSKSEQGRRQLSITERARQIYITGEEPRADT